MLAHIFRIWLGFLLANLAAAQNCPKLSDSSPCKCIYGHYADGNGIEVECRNINSKDTLYEELRKFRGYPILILKLSDIRIPFLPSGLSIGLSINRLVIENCQIGNLYSPEDATPSPFAGLEGSLKEIRITDTRELNNWFWPDVKKFKKLTKVSITNSLVDFVGHTFAEIGGGSLKSIGVRHSKVNRIHPQAFSELTNLYFADFEGNNLPYLVRTMFPNPAPELKFLNFKSNRLFTLNENMFENMPALTYLDLSRNEFKNFESVPFTPLWNQLEHLFLSENPFECGCSLVPLKQRLTSNTVPASHDLESVTCINHGDFRKRKLYELDIASLQC